MSGAPDGSPGKVGVGAPGHRFQEQGQCSLTIAELGLQLETRVERQVSVVDMLETRVQETQQVVADLGSSFNELEDDLELRVDEIGKSVLDSSKKGPGTICQEPGAMGVMRSRIATYDLLKIVSHTWNVAGLEGCTASSGRDTSTWCSGCPFL